MRTTEITPNGFVSNQKQALYLQDTKRTKEILEADSSTRPLFVVGDKLWRPEHRSGVRRSGVKPRAKWLKNG